MQQAIQWATPPQELALHEDTVHIWCANLDLATPVSSLSADEQQRAARYHFARDQLRYSAGRAILRTLLGRYTGLPPEALTFRYSPFGKPFLHTDVSLSFNLAHSQHLALYAFSQRTSLGIDVEALRPLPDMEQMAARFFAPSEWIALRELPAARQLHAFYTLWTCKEAYLKADGAGLSRGIHKVELSLYPLMFSSIDDDTGLAGQWSLLPFTPSSGFLAALALYGTLPDVQFYRFV